MNTKILAGGIALLALSLNAQVKVQILPRVAGAQAQTFEYVSSFMTSDLKPVKGAPYSADTSNESVQMLADGNRLVHKNATKVYRDSEGRTRREQTLEALGPWSASSGQPRQLIFISDPVAGVGYTLDPSTRTAWKTTVMHYAESDGKSTFTVETHMPSELGALARVGPGGATVITQNIQSKIARSGSGSDNVVKEQLGKRTFDGVEAEGTRTTVTIPAGQIGNEREIQTVTETWYSPELQMVIRTETRDPRMGNTTYAVSNISRSEQPKYLFEIPSDYTLKEERARPARIQLKKNEM